MSHMRGYFGIGVESISKPGNVGNLVRSAHAFGASFVFFISPVADVSDIRVSDTSNASVHVPQYVYPDVAALTLPEDCTLVGVELTEDSIELPSFRHPLRAAYVFGPEKGSLSPALVKKCAYVVRIPTKFCINVGMAGVIALYDRMISLGKFAERPVRTGGPLTHRPRRGHG
jgi:tRNA G18 (ribose-2'-O)-methylase SpoU